MGLRSVAATLSPAALRRTAIMISRNLGAASGPGFKSRRQQLLELSNLALRGHFYPNEYFLYRFGLIGKTYDEMLRYLPNKIYLYEVRWAWNAQKWLMLAYNKWLFHLHYKAMGVPVTKVHGYYHGADGCTIDGAPLRCRSDLLALLRRVQPRSLVIKPVAGLQGKGVLILKQLEYRNGQILATGIGGTPLALDQVFAHLELPLDHLLLFAGPGQLVSYGGYLLEECAEDHPFFKEINPYTATVLRIVTYLNPNGQVDVDFAIARLGRKGSQAANWDQGGLSVKIDVETGMLGAGVIKPNHGGGWHIVHPDSGVPFLGRTIPLWNEVLQACKLAAAVSPGLRSVGWDVILTPTGPCIIEGNTDWTLSVVQIHSDGYLTPKVRQRLSGYGIQPPSKLSRPSLRGLLMLLQYAHDGNRLVPVAKAASPAGQAVGPATASAASARSAQNGGAARLRTPDQMPAEPRA